MTDLSQSQQKPLAEAEIPIEEFNLSMRAYNCLKHAQVNFVSDLIKFSYEDLLGIKSFGCKSAEEVIKALEGIGITLYRGCSPALAQQPLQPTDKELCDTYLKAYYTEANRQGPHCMAAGLRAVLARWGQS